VEGYVGQSRLNRKQKRPAVLLLRGTCCGISF